MAGTAKLPRTVVTPGIGTSSVLVCPANPTRTALFVFNPGTIQLSICADDTTAVSNGAGSITLLPQTGIELDGWTAGINAIAASGSNNPVTIHEYS